ncbi:MAG: rhodanese-like domain-containing protein [Isosphaeraceae bacterium]
MTRRIWLSGLALIISSVTQNLTAQDAKPTHTTDDLKTVKAAVTSGKAVLLDVREKAEWDNGHLKDAKLMPTSELTSTKGESFLKLGIDKKKVIYTHCKLGIRALRMATMLKEKGYDVRALKPGFDELVEAGFPEAK